jgi:predicted secreted hydrolase
MKDEGVSRRRVLTLLGGVAGTFVTPKTFAQVTSNQSLVTGHQSPVTPFAKVIPGYTLRFPHDEGSHPEFRTEWWYVTGWLDAPGAKALGFQITFFRTRPELKDDNPSAFTPRQILIAHAALSDPALGRLQHDQRAARAGLTLAGADTGRTRVWIDDWSLAQEDGAYRARIAAEDFRFDFTLNATQPPLLQGDRGLSRKGPRPGSASYYYSLPQLTVSGTLERSGKAQPVTGSAWLDHEWSSSYMDSEAVGWDWIGINLADGGALMAFRMRDQRGGKFWAGGSYRSPEGVTRTLGMEDIDFAPRRQWRSPRTGTAYPVSWTVRAGALRIEIQPLMDDQENDTRLSTGTIYWEGAVRALRDGKPAGRGYLELTGYWRPLQL